LRRLGNLRLLRLPRLRRLRNLRLLRLPRLRRLRDLRLLSLPRRRKRWPRRLLLVTVALDRTDGDPRPRAAGRKRGPQEIGAVLDTRNGREVAPGHEIDALTLKCQVVDLRGRHIAPVGNRAVVMGNELLDRDTRFVQR